MADFDEKAISSSGIRDLSDPFSPAVQKDELLISTGQGLEKRLKACSPGRNDWKEFQNICEEIIKFCFKDSFEEPYIKQEETTWDGHQRADILVKNRPKANYGSQYWANLARDFDCQSVIFECKNYTKGIGKEEVLQAKDYEWPNTGRFRVILTRVEPADDAIRAIRHWFFYGLKMKIIILTDVELVEMITMRMKDELPERVLYKAEDRRPSCYQ